MELWHWMDVFCTNEHPVYSFEKSWRTNITSAHPRVLEDLYIQLLLQWDSMNITMFTLLSLTIEGSYVIFTSIWQCYEIWNLILCYGITTFSVCPVFFPTSFVLLGSTTAPLHHCSVGQGCDWANQYKWTLPKHRNQEVILKKNI